MLSMPRIVRPDLSELGPEQKLDPPLDGLRAQTFSETKNWINVRQRYYPSQEWHHHQYRLQ